MYQKGKANLDLLEQGRRVVVGSACNNDVVM